MKSNAIYEWWALLQNSCGFKSQRLCLCVFLYLNLYILLVCLFISSSEYVVWYIMLLAFVLYICFRLSCKQLTPDIRVTKGRILAKMFCFCLSEQMTLWVVFPDKRDIWGCLFMLSVKVVIIISRKIWKILRMSDYAIVCICSTKYYVFFFCEIICIGALNGRGLNGRWVW